MWLRQAIPFISLLLSAQAQNDGLAIKTVQGEVVGINASPGVRRFLGIPYAVAGRWEAPQLPPKRQVTFQALNFGNICPQAGIPVLASLDLGGDDTNTTEAEDCLSINIWAPSTDRKQRTAVMVFMYGGGFLIGTSSTPIYNGQYLVQKHDDITIVSFNYRLSVFGQPNAPQFFHGAQAQNFGLLDTNAAIQWVYDNIAAFGGDPERIILFGESAGAIAIDAYTYAFPDDTRVKGIIMQSGNLLTPGITRAYSSDGNRTFDSSLWLTMANAVGCGNDNVTDATQLECVKKVPWRDLNVAVTANNLTFVPVADGITIFNDTANRATAGKFLRVPTLSGTNKNEADLHIVSSQLVTLNKTIPYLTELLADVTTLLLFVCPDSQTVADRLAAGVPTWRYRYDAVFRDISIHPDLRAFHGSELPIIFDTYDKTVTSKVEVTLAKYVQGAWVAFARDPVKGLSNYGWPLYNPNATTVAQIGGFYNETGVSFILGEDLDDTCGSQDVLGQTIGLLGALLGPGGSSVLIPGSGESNF